MIAEEELKRALYILHLGLVEIRNLALANDAEQIADLADALEILPTVCLVQSNSQLREYLKAYTSKHQGTLISDDMWDKTVCTNEIVDSAIRSRTSG